MKRKLLNAVLVCFVTLTFNAQTEFGPKQTINANTGNNPFAIASGLIDGDAYADIITATTITNQLIWYKNNADGTFTAQPNIPNTIDFVTLVQLMDLNNDTFLDVVVTGYSSNSVTWYANDGLGNFGPEQLIGTVNTASGLDFGDIDGDSTIDVAATSITDNNIVWFSNDGTGTFGSANVIDNTLIAPGTIVLRDIDNDGDLDALVSTAKGSGNVDVLQIFHNDLIPNGTVDFIKDATPVTSGKNYFNSAIFEDLDGDSDFDILATELNVTTGTGHFYWYENTGSGFTENLIATTIGNPSTVLFKDLDNDGLKDIVLSSGTAGEGKDIVWFKNNGAGVFDSELVIDATQSNTFAMTIVDFDNDDDLDIASLSYNQNDLNWFENLKFTLGMGESFLQHVKMFPNPTKNLLYFEGIKNESVISVYDMLGKQILTTSISEGESLDVSALNNGIYILKFDGNNSTFKFIKE